MNRWILSVLTILSFLPATIEASQPPASFASLVEKLSPAVVNISTSQTVKQNGAGLNLEGFENLPDHDAFKEFLEKFGQQLPGDMNGNPQNITSLGSGFVIDPAGYIVTNFHVIEKASTVTVTFADETQYEAKIVGRDKKTDLALLKIEAGKPLPHVTFGDSDAMRVGDWVIAIGNPFGFSGSVSAGIISARSRNINAGPFDDFIQTDAAINRGNSGGPLFNLDGQVIGVNSAIFSPNGGNLGIGFSIPSALAKPVLSQLREFGRTHRGWLGVRIQHVTKELAESVGLPAAKGALVLDVNPKSPAYKAGIKSGDVILSFAGQPIDEMRQLPRKVAETKIGTTVAIIVWRDESEVTVNVTLGEMKEEEQHASPDQQGGSVSPDAVPTETWKGAQLAALTDALRVQFDINKAVKGILVLKVAPETAAFQAKLQRGDVIVEANQTVISSIEELKRAVRKAKYDGKNNALLRVSRRGGLAFSTITTKE